MTCNEAKDGNTTDRESVGVRDDEARYSVVHGLSEPLVVGQTTVAVVRKKMKFPGPASGDDGTHSISESLDRSSGHFCW
jgi:hypothetical protein